MTILGRALVWLLALFLLTAVVCGIAFHRVMFPGRVDLDTVVETVSFVVQTVTTVGYGNWMPTDWEPGHPPPAPGAVRTAKIVSVVLMLCGGGLFTVLVGLVSNAIWAQAERERDGWGES